ncbi:MAG TPA: M42 family peptidase, partial [Candidatus Omnitrophica bacterium]|nr:M42 family peptidase [Candidatus Omnitrophota bacterium]
CKESFKFLEEVIEAPSPSGFESKVRKIIKERMRKITEDITIDVVGNLIGVLNKDGRPRLMLAAHCDEIGFMVKYISDEGYIYFTPIGGIDAHLIPGRRVYIHTGNGKVLGVIGKKPIHLMEEEERKKVSKIENMWIDIGVKDKKEAQKMVSIGDPITFAYGLEILKGELFISRAFDDKIGAYLIIEIMEKLKSQKFSSLLHGVITVQEEIGLRGAIPSTFGVNPDIGICLEVTYATDHPSVDKKKTGEFKLGEGPVICRGANINPKLFDLLVDTAKKGNIPYQVSAEPRGTPTDANVMQLCRKGVATAVVCLPLRYLHTPVEMLSIKDLDNMEKLIITLIKRITPDMDFTL